MIYRGFFKRVLDIVFSIIGLLFLSPIFLLLMICIKLDSSGPVFFKQQRIGKGRAAFSIYKFRTMRVDAPHDIPTHLFMNPNDYITRVGRFLRKSSLDELPQIINILKGEMSFIGPRPALWNQYDLLEARDQNGANDVTPGLTGWAQINGRDELPFDLKAWLDGEYVAKMGFALDAKIFFLTVANVLTGKDIKEGTKESKLY
ncbi:sugar transferase [Paenibacillus sp. BSR1-1]|uniref:sugar transferase n=1 Tax=Paenibacillus sp. BSR1-1 TaxID=3020845 RepID=UPI0025B1B252|nr:sugar transferase [Paenibacillus sp. BSR1-1]MDN3019193.1 sugar transferase [Paenibacillus sp. BSR1-1]